MSVDLQSASSALPAVPAAGFQVPAVRLEVPAVRPATSTESVRLAALRGSGVLVARPQQALDALARAAAVMCGASIGVVNLLDDTSQITVSSFGFEDYGFAAVGPRSDSVCRYTIAAPGELTEIADLTADPRTRGVPVALAGLRFYAGASVLSSVTADSDPNLGAALGAVCVLDRETRALSPAQRAGLRDLAAVAATLIEQHGRAQQLVGVADRLGREADTDPLTGLYNRRALQPVLANLPPRTAVAMVDLDHFKRLNDTAGHLAGDRALCAYADLFRTGLRDGDVAARWGGEEFLLVLHDARSPRRTLERLARRAGISLPVTFSAGLTLAGSGEDPNDLLARADRLLYRAKQAGRARICDDLG